MCPQDASVHRVMDKPRKIETEVVRPSAVHSDPTIGRTSGSAEILIETLTDQVCDHVTESLEAVQRTIERRIISRVLKKTGGNQTQAARLLGIKRTTLSYKLKKLKIGR
jgi:DNA-binding protein Fis